MSKASAEFTRLYELALTLKNEGKIQLARDTATLALTAGRKTMPADHFELKKCQGLLDLLTPKS